MKLMVYLLGPLLPVVEAIVRVLMRACGIRIGANRPILSPTERLRGRVSPLPHAGTVDKQGRAKSGRL